MVAILMLVTVLVPVNADKEICAYYFYREGCANCVQVEPVIEELQEKYTNFNITKLSVDVSENSALLWKFMNAYGIEGDSQPLPIVIIDEQLFAGVKPVEDNLESIIKEHPEGLACPAPEEKKPEALSLWTLIILALADAVNPCELAVLLLLLITIAKAAMDGRSKKVLFAGLAFSSAIFLAYFGMGLGLFKVIQLAGVSHYIKIVIGALAVAIGLFNLKDFVKLGSFGFKTEVPEKWRPRMKNLIRSVTSVPGAFIVGILVSLFLTPCTAGPYFVAVGILSSVSIFKALPLLLMYNLIFIAPMIALTLIVYFGASAEKIQNWRTSHTRWLHLITGIIMTVLGMLLLVSII